MSAPGAESQPPSGPTPEDQPADGAAAEALRASLQAAQAAVEQARCGPAVRAAVAVGRRLGRPPLRTGDALGDVAAAPPTSASASVVAHWRATTDRRQLEHDLDRERRALARLRSEPVLRAAARADALVRPLGGVVARRPGAGSRGEVPPDLVVSTAVVSARHADEWGDWHLAGALGDALRARGVRVRRQRADQAGDAVSRSASVHLIVRGVRRVAVHPGQPTALWVISHPEQVLDAELDEVQLVVVASEAFAAHLRGRTATPVEVLHQATDPRRFARAVGPAARPRSLVVVANAHHRIRPAVAAALGAGLRPAIYGAGWGGLVDPELVVADRVPNESLAQVYSAAEAVLADHWGTMRAWAFPGNRLFDVLACGTPVLTDDVEGAGDLLGPGLATWHDPASLGAVVEAVRSDPEGWRARAEASRQIVLARHTMGHRADELVGHLRDHLPDGAAPRWPTSDG